MIISSHVLISHILAITPKQHVCNFYLKLVSLTNFQFSYGTFILLKKLVFISNFNVFILMFVICFYFSLIALIFDL